MIDKRKVIILTEKGYLENSEDEESITISILINKHTFNLFAKRAGSTNVEKVSNYIFKTALNNSLDEYNPLKEEKND